jgi:hypothetical protein
VGTFSSSGAKYEKNNGKSAQFGGHPLPPGSA